jgi:hypothetical protein
VRNGDQNELDVFLMDGDRMNLWVLVVAVLLCYVSAAVWL